MNALHAASCFDCPGMNIFISISAQHIAFSYRFYWLASLQFLQTTASAGLQALYAALAGRVRFAEYASSFCLMPALARASVFCNRCSLDRLLR